MPADRATWPVMLVKRASRLLQRAVSAHLHFAWGQAASPCTAPRGITRCGYGTRFAKSLAQHERFIHSQLIMEDLMGKYFLAWLLGVPASLLVLIYLFTHIF